MTRMDDPGAPRLEIADAPMRDMMREILLRETAQGRARARLLVIDAAAQTDGETGAQTSPALSLSAQALARAQAFAAQALAAQSGAKQDDVCIVLVAGPAGPDKDALAGLVRALARALAPARVNALAPLVAGARLDPAQAAQALAYLAGAPVVTGQTMEIGAPR
jgi:hypothetical protein